MGYFYPQDWGASPGAGDRANDKLGPGQPTLADQAISTLMGATPVPQVGQAAQALQDFWRGNTGAGVQNLGLLGAALAPMLVGGGTRAVGQPIAKLLEGEAGPAARAIEGEGWGAARAADAKFPQYAEVYPPVGPPNIKLKDSGVGTFESKQLTPEAEAFAKERLRIQKDMDRNGYTPYFDPEQRSYVDPANYPPANVDTSTVVPSKPVTVANYAQQIDAPYTTAALQHAYDRGMELGNTDHWYAMAQLEKKYTDQLGPEAGRAAFLDQFAAPMAATTSGQNPTANFLMAHFLEYNRAKGDPVPVGHQLPYPVGGQYAGDNLKDYIRMREGGGYAALGAKQPKMHDFSRSMIGDLSNPVIDDQMAKGMLSYSGMPPAFPNNARSIAYGMMQQPVRDMAAEMGVPPGNVQDVAWAGFKNEAGGPMIKHINDSIERTHRLTGMSRDEIVERGLIGKKIPMYGLLGGVGLGAAAEGSQ